MIPRSCLLELPKTDLHVHLDGSLRLSSLIELAAARGVALPSHTEDGLNELVFKESYANLSEYLQGFAYTCAVLRDEESLERAAYELAWDNLEEGVCYVEVRFAPQLHMGWGLSYQQVLRAVDAGLARARREHEASEAVSEQDHPPFRYGIIVCALRMFTPAFSAWYQTLIQVMGEAPRESVYATASLELARAAVRVRDEGVPIVGFDLAGEEAGYPAETHIEAFQHAHEHFLAKTVHAGEAYGPESIFQAVTDLHADRLGHGYHLFAAELIRAGVEDREAYVSALAQYVADRRITIEVCITSNLQTNPGIGSVERHAFRDMLDAQLSATLCTDNRLVSHTTVTREYELAVQAFDMSPSQLRNTIVYGFKRSFFWGSYPDKRAYVRKVIDRYDAVAKKHGLER